MSSRNKKPAQMPNRAGSKKVVAVVQEEYEEIDEDEEDVLEDDAEDLLVEQQEEEYEDDGAAAEEAGSGAVAVASGVANSHAVLEKLDAMIKLLGRNVPTSSIPSLVPVMKGHSDIKVVELIVEMSGKPNDLQNLDALSIWRPTDAMQTFGSRTRYSRDCKPSKERQGDLKNVMLQAIQVTAYKNNFPCQVAVTIPEIYHARGNRRDGTDKQYALICMASTSDLRTHEVMVESEFHRSDFFRKYPTYTLDNLSSQGIMHNPKTGVHLVHIGQPVVEFLEADEESKALLAKAVAVSGEHYYEIPSPHFKKAMRNLERSARENLPSYDINKFYIKFVRPYSRDWNDPVEICDNYTSPDLISAALEKVYRINLHVRMAYLLM